MSDRLKDLQRQRAMMQEQLAWLDREIARETGVPAASPVPTPVAPPSAPVPISSPAQAPVAPRLSSNPQTAAMAEKIISQYQSQTQSLQSNVKRGCFLYLLFAFGLVGLGVLALYLLSAWK